MGGRQGLREQETTTAASNILQTVPSARREDTMRAFGGMRGHRLRVGRDGGSAAADRLSREARLEAGRLPAGGDAGRERLRLRGDPPAGLHDGESDRRRQRRGAARRRPGQPAGHPDPPRPHRQAHAQAVAVVRGRLRPRRPHRRQLGPADGRDLHRPSDLAGADGAGRRHGDGRQPEGRRRGAVRGQAGTDAAAAGDRPARRR